MMNLIIQGINWGIIGGVAVVVGTAMLVITAILGLMLFGLVAAVVELVKVIYHAIKGAIK